MNYGENLAGARPHRTERYEVIIIGASEWQLAVAYHLASHDVDFLIIDAATRLGSWRLEHLVERFDLPVRVNTRIASVTPGNPYTVIATATIRYEAEQVIAATGEFSKSDAEQVADVVVKRLRDRERLENDEPTS